MATLPSISHLDKVAYLFGTPIRHSLSPVLHRTVFAGLSLNYDYLLFESADFSAFLQLLHDPKCVGSAVTMPHKVAIIPHLDSLTPEGKAIGAINTVFFNSGPNGERLLVGTNTDCIGIREGIRHNVSEEQFASYKGRPALIIGGGGTSRAAVYSLKKFLGCSPIYFLNREKSEVDAVVSECTASGFGDNLIHINSLEQAESLSAPAVIVSAVPDFPPKTEAEILVRKMLEVLLAKDEGKGAILEMCYHPSTNTQITKIGKEAGWKVIPGTEAMVWQGLEQDKYWTGRSTSEMPAAAAQAAVAKALESHN